MDTDAPEKIIEEVCNPAVAMFEILGGGNYHIHISGLAGVGYIEMQQRIAQVINCGCKALKDNHHCHPDENPCPIEGKENICCAYCDLLKEDGRCPEKEGACYVVLCFMGASISSCSSKQKEPKCHVEEAQSAISKHLTPP